MLKAIQEFLNELGLQMLLQYNANNLRASGKFEDRILVKDNKLTWTGIGYPIYIFEGNTRGPGKSPPVFDIFKWLFDKGITPRDRRTGRFISYESAAYIISRAIGQRGTQFEYSRPIDFGSASDKAWKKVAPKIGPIIAKEIFKAAKWTSPNTIKVEL